MLPVLVLLFLVSYGLMTMLIVEQGRTIDSQRTLIHQLLGDSFQLSALRGKAIQKEHASAQVQPKDKVQMQTPSPQVKPRDFQAQTPQPRSHHKPTQGMLGVQEKFGDQRPENRHVIRQTRRISGER